MYSPKTVDVVLHESYTWGRVVKVWMRFWYLELSAKEVFKYYVRTSLEVGDLSQISDTAYTLKGVGGSEEKYWFPLIQLQCTKISCLWEYKCIFWWLGTCHIKSSNNWKACPDKNDAWEGVKIPHYFMTIFFTLTCCPILLYRISSREVQTV